MGHLKRIVAITDENQRIEVVSTPRAINLMAEKLVLVPQVTQVHEIACTVQDFTYPPEDYIPNLRHHKMWCPYCGEERRFLNIRDTNNANCEICRMSDSDFYIKQINSTFDIEKAMHKARRKAKRAVKNERKAKIKELKEQKE